VRVRIVARDVCKVPEIAEGAILPYLYDFHFEREVEMGNPPIEIPITIPEKKKEKISLLLKRLRQMDNPHLNSYRSV
jgi:hypothetical protein